MEKSRFLLHLALYESAYATTARAVETAVSKIPECRDQLQIGPRTRVRVDGASGFWKIMAALTFLGLKWIYRCRRGSRGRTRARGGSLPRPHLDPRQEAAPALWVTSSAPLRSLSSSWRKNNHRKVSSNSDNIFRSKFLKQKDSKNRKLALGIFLQNA